MLGGFDHGLPQAKTLLEPTVESDASLLYPWHDPHLGLGCSSAASRSAESTPTICVSGGSSFAWLASVGILPALIISEPSTTLWSYSNNPRSGGPEAREPSA
jgi:hypothetical protein